MYYVAVYSRHYNVVRYTPLPPALPHARDGPRVR